MNAWGFNYFQNPMQTSWFNMPICLNPSFGFSLPPLFNFGVPRSSVFDNNIFNFTPPTNCCFTPQFNFGFNPTTTNPFAFLNENTKTTQTATTVSTSTPRTQKHGKYVEEEILQVQSVLKYGKGINVDELKPDLKKILVRLDKKAKELGYEMVVVDGFRSHAAQEKANRNKPKLAAPVGKSPHEYGAAIDIALYKNGKQVDISKVPEFANYAKQIGLNWGNDWSSKKEPWHFELKGWKNRSDIAREYREYNKIAVA